jgi:hypothetical protein
MVLAASDSGNAGEVPTYAYHYYDQYKTRPHFRAFVITSIWKRYGVATYYYRSSSIDAAIAGALDNCQKIAMDGKSAATSFDCKLHSIGNIFVYRMSDEELDTAKKLYKQNRSATNENLAGFIPGKSSIESAPTLAVEDHDDAKLCKIALTGSKTYWETRPVFLPYVKEAKRRGLSIEGCRSKLGLATSTPAPEPVTDEQALKQSVKFERALSDYLEIQFGVEFDGFDSLEIKKVSGQILTVDVRYFYSANDLSQRPARASTNVRKIGSSYKIVEFKSIFPSASQLRKLGRSEAGGSY